MIRPLGRMLVATALVLVGSACQGGAGDVMVDDALAITSIQVRGNSGTVVIRGTTEGPASESGVHGTHNVSGVGAKGRARVSIDELGTMLLETDCAPLLPCRLDLTLNVPEHLPISVDLSSGTVRTEGVAETDIQVDRGVVEVVDGFTSVVRIGTGRLDAQLHADGALRAVVARGDVDVAVPPGGWQITTAAAELRLSGVALDRQARGVLDVHAPSGSVLLAGVKDLAAR